MNYLYKEIEKEKLIEYWFNNYQSLKTTNFQIDKKRYLIEDTFFNFNLSLVNNVLTINISNKKITNIILWFSTLLSVIVPLVVYFTQPSYDNDYTFIKILIAFCSVATIGNFTLLYLYKTNALIICKNHVKYCISNNIKL